MARRRKKNKRYVLAVKDYENTVKKVTDGSRLMPAEPSIYKDIFDSVVEKCADFNCLKRFIRKTKIPRKECIHYWEGLISLGHTLILIEYDAANENLVENACDNELIQYVCSA